MFEKIMKRIMKKVKCTQVSDHVYCANFHDYKKKDFGFTNKEYVNFLESGAVITADGDWFIDCSNKNYVTFSYIIGTLVDESTDDLKEAYEQAKAQYGEFNPERYRNTTDEKERMKMIVLMFAPAELERRYYKWQILMS